MIGLLAFAPLPVLSWRATATGTRVVPYHQPLLRVTIHFLFLFYPLHVLSCFMRHFGNNVRFVAHWRPGRICHAHDGHRRRTIAVPGHRHWLLQVLTEMIGTEELLCLIALAELVCLQDMIASMIPVCRVGKLIATVAADVRRTVVARRRVERCLNRVKSCTRP
jgi:hypothetical protein